MKRRRIGFLDDDDPPQNNPSVGSIMQLNDSPPDDNSALVDALKEARDAINRAIAEATKL